MCHELEVYVCFSLTACTLTEDAVVFPLYDSDIVEKVDAKTTHIVSQMLASDIFLTEIHKKYPSIRIVRPSWIVSTHAVCEMVLTLMDQSQSINLAFFLCSRSGGSRKVHTNSPDASDNE